GGARGPQSTGGAEGQLPAPALVGDEVHFAEDGADQQVGGAVAVPVRREGRGGAADVERLAVPVLQLFAGGEGPVRLAAEEVDLARPGAGEYVGSAVAVQVHQLWSEADASPLGDRRDPAAGLEPGARLELRLGPGAGVAVDAQPALVELADQQGERAVLEEVADER